MFIFCLKLIFLIVLSLGTVGFTIFCSLSLFAYYKELFDGGKDEE